MNLPLRKNDWEVLHEHMSHNPGHVIERKQLIKRPPHHSETDSLISDLQTLTQKCNANEKTRQCEPPKIYKSPNLTLVAPKWMKFQSIFKNW